MRFESPWMFALVVVVALLVVYRLFRGKGASLRFSSTAHVKGTGRSLRQRLLWAPLGLRTAALVLLIAAIARPQEGKEIVRDVSEGIAIEMVLDRSGSMQAEMEYEGERLNRLEVVKRVFEEFVTGKGRDLPGRPEDLIGMITFARYADTVCPLTLAHGALLRFIDSVKLVSQRSEDGTAIGDAVALGAARLVEAEETLKAQVGKQDEAYKIKSKVMILLTDGQNNAGKRSPLQAAETAKEWGIKIYAIGIGGEESVTTIRTPLGDYKVPMRGGVDTGVLQKIAESTGGFFKNADNADSLREIYSEIDKMERTEIESVRYLDYYERFQPFAVAVLALLALEILLNCTVFRKIP